MRAIVAMLAAGLVAGCGGAAVSESPPPGGAAQGSGLRPERTHPAPPLPHGRYLTAQLRRSIALRARPAAGARVLARAPRRTEFGSPRVLGVLEHRGAWLRVQAPELPNGRAAWIPTGAAKLAATDLSIHVDRSARELTLRDKQRAVVSMPVAVGRPGNQTPLGRFSVTDRLHTDSPDSPYGCCAIALTGHQRHLPPGWPGGDRLAIHGTPQTGTIGQAASLGCLRAPTRGLRVLMRRIALGTPVFIAS